MFIYIMLNNNKSYKPYILNIKKFKNNEDLLYISNNYSNNNNKLSKKKSPLSGSELDYKPELWNENNNIRTSHNCYSY